jgi:8-oxo-dGTP diphosphatase
VTLKQINVVGAVILRDGLILCAQRGPGGSLGGMWEFPGGKIERGETAREALIREIEEELLCEIVVGDEVTTTTHDYDFGTVTLTTFRCELVHGEPTLTEHADVKWVEPADLGELAWAPADRPAVAMLGVR